MKTNLNFLWDTNHSNTKALQVKTFGWDHEFLLVKIYSSIIKHINISLSFASNNLFKVKTN